MINPMDLSEHRILVTGASGGIGRVTCILLSNLGAKVILVARREDALNETLSLMSGTDHVIASFDLAQVDLIPDWIKGITDQHGSLHGLVHCAGIQRSNVIRNFDNQAVQEIMQINFNSAYSIVRGFRQKHVHASPSSIVLLSSIGGLVGMPGNTVYTASKGAIISVVRSFSLELARQGIRVNCVAPGIVQTDMVDKFRNSISESQFNQISESYPLGLGNPDDVANAIAFLLADTGRWITGTTLVIDGGYTAR
ncbi:SDR family oxidoreductase [bacterium]|nr:SDR family oxidoreductase [bacterium]